MAETKKTEAAAAAAPPEAACLTLRQKLVEMRKACPEIVKKQHSDGVSYKYAKIYDVWEKITPIMNELGVDFDVISEQATRHAENGDPVYWITMQTKTRNGDKLMFLYERIKGIDRTLIDKPSETAATDLAADVEFLVETYEPRVQLSDSDLKALTAQAGDFELRASIDNIT